MADFIEWTDKLTLGIQAIDDQHRRMFRLLEQLAEAMARLKTADAIPPTDKKPRDDVDREQGREKQAERFIHQLLEELVRLTQEHFRSEEKLMAANRYPNLNEHRREHVMLFAELKSFVRDISEGLEHLDQKTLCYLKQWLIVHLRESDKAYADYVHGCESQ